MTLNKNLGLINLLGEGYPEQLIKVTLLISKQKMFTSKVKGDSQYYSASFCESQLISEEIASTSSIYILYQDSFNKTRRC